MRILIQRSIYNEVLYFWQWSLVCFCDCPRNCFINFQSTMILFPLKIHMIVHTEYLPSSVSTKQEIVRTFLISLMVDVWKQNICIHTYQYIYFKLRDIENILKQYFRKPHSADKLLLKQPPSRNYTCILSYSRPQLFKTFCHYHCVI